MRYPSRHRRPPIAIRSTSFRSDSLPVVPQPEFRLRPSFRLSLKLAAPPNGAALSVHHRSHLDRSTGRATELSLVLPIPPSINHQYATVNGRRLLSAQGRSYKALVGQEVLIALSHTPARLTVLETFRANELALCIRFFFTSRLRRDVDGGLKIAQDALCQALGINDNRVVETHLYKQVDKASPRMEIRLCVATKA